MSTETLSEGQRQAFDPKNSNRFKWGVYEMIREIVDNVFNVNPFPDPFSKTEHKPENSELTRTDLTQNPPKSI